jgi:hypothetical protein
MVSQTYFDFGNNVSFFTSESGAKLSIMFQRCGIVIQGSWYLYDGLRQYHCWKWPAKTTSTSPRPVQVQVVSRRLSVKVWRYQRGKAPTIPSSYFISIKQCICVCNQVWVRCLLFLQVTSNNDIVSVHHTNTMIPVLQWFP